MLEPPVSSPAAGAWRLLDRSAGLLYVVSLESASALDGVVAVVLKGSQPPQLGQRDSAAIVVDKVARTGRNQNSGCFVCRTLVTAQWQDGGGSSDLDVVYASQTGRTRWVVS